MRKEEKGSMCSEATKDTPTEGANVPYKGKSIGKRKKVK